MDPDDLDALEAMPPEAWFDLAGFEAETPPADTPPTEQASAASAKATFQPRIWEEEGYLCVADFAYFSGMRTSQVRKLFVAGRLNGQQFGSQFYILKTELTPKAPR
jgi:hypothetical protein